MEPVGMRGYDSTTHPTQPYGEGPCPPDSRQEGQGLMGTLPLLRGLSRGGLLNVAILRRSTDDRAGPVAREPESFQRQL